MSAIGKLSFIPASPANNWRLSTQSANRKSTDQLKNIFKQYIPEIDWNTPMVSEDGSEVVHLEKFIALVNESDSKLAKVRLRNHFRILLAKGGLIEMDPPVDINIPDARLSLNLISGISAGKDPKLKMAALDALIEILERDPLVLESCIGLVQMAKKMMEQLQIDIAQEQTANVLLKMVTAFGLTIELILRHYEKQHCLAVSADLKSQLHATGEKIQCLNTHNQPDMEFAVAFALEGIKRLADDDLSLLSLFRRISQVAEALGKFYKGEVGTGIHHLQDACIGMLDNVKASWFDCAYLCKSLIIKDDFTIGLENLTNMFSLSKDMRTDWKLNYYYVQLLSRVVIKGTNPADCIKAFELLVPFLNTSQFKDSKHRKEAVQRLKTQEATSNNWTIQSKTVDCLVQIVRECICDDIVAKARKLIDSKTKQEENLFESVENEVKQLGTDEKQIQAKKKKEMQLAKMESRVRFLQERIEFLKLADSPEEKKAVLLDGKVDQLSKKRFRVLQRRPLQETNALVHQELLNAAKFGNIECLLRCISQGGSICVSDARGNRPLHLAAHRGHKDIVEALLDNDAAVDDENKDGALPIDLAIENENAEVIKILARAQIDSEANQKAKAKLQAQYAKYLNEGKAEIEPTSPPNLSSESIEYQEIVAKKVLTLGPKGHSAKRIVKAVHITRGSIYAIITLPIAIGLPGFQAIKDGLKDLKSKRFRLLSEDDPRFKMFAYLEENKIELADGELTKHKQFFIELAKTKVFLHKFKKMLSYCNEERRSRYVYYFKQNGIISNDFKAYPSNDLADLLLPTGGYDSDSDEYEPNWTYD